MAVPKANTLLSEGRLPLCPDLDSALYDRIGLPKGARLIDKNKTRIWNACEQDPAFFIFGGFVRTFDPHDRKNPHKPFPDEPYLRTALEFIHQETEVAAIAKSRQLMVSWLLCAYAVWEARFHAHRHVMMQSKKAEDAWALVFNDWMTSRCGFIEYAMPEILWHPDDSRPVVGMRGKIVYPQGSMIWGIPSGAHHFRSHVASLAFIDEACFMPDFADTYTAALAMVKGGGRLRIVSTARYDSYFGKLIEADNRFGEAA